MIEKSKVHLFKIFLRENPIPIPILACGGDFYQTTGAFSSPNFPNSYPRNTRCEWIVHVAEGNEIYLKFRYVNLINTYLSTYISVHLPTVQRLAQKPLKSKVFHLCSIDAGGL